MNAVVIFFSYVHHECGYGSVSNKKEEAERARTTSRSDSAAEFAHTDSSKFYTFSV